MTSENFTPSAHQMEQNGLDSDAVAPAPAMPSPSATSPQQRPGWVEPWVGRKSLFVVGIMLLLAAIVVSVLQPATRSQAAPLAPSFSLPHITQAGQLSLSSLRGHTVLLNFFNSDCAPCLDELPTLRKLAKQYAGQGVVLVGVATFGDSVRAVTDLAQRAGLHYQMVLDHDSAVAQSFGVQGIPTTIFIEPHGRIKGTAVGPLTPDVVEKGIAATHSETCPCGPLNATAAELQQASSVSQTSGGLSGDTVFAARQWTAPQFSLHDETGHTVTITGLRGHPVIVTFTDAHCTEDCPVIGKALRQVVDTLGSDARRVSIISVSVDPVGDTPAALRHFSATTGMTGHWHILQGSRAALAAVWRAYGIYVAAPKPGAGGDIAHTAAIFLIDPQGSVRVLDSVPFNLNQVVASMRVLLAS